MRLGYLNHEASLLNVNIVLGNYDLFESTRKEV
jgi:hypothetical protein